MKRTTRKLSGPAKRRFLEHFIAAEPGLEAGLASRLSTRCDEAFTSLRIRRSVALTPRRKVPEEGGTAATIGSFAPSPPASPPAHEGAPAPASVPPAPEPFDPYVFGLVPTFQREGRDGLIRRLGTIESIVDLRQMAKVQQIVLPPDLRSGSTDAVALRAGIAEAVAKRIADRRAAAG